MVEKVPTTNRKNKVIELTTKNDPTWQVLADRQIILPLAGLLKLVPVTDTPSVN